jgi:hypothetical protein
MEKTMKEAELVDLFISKMNLSNEYEYLHHETAPNPSNPHMDIEFLYKKEYIRAEAKCNNDIRKISGSSLEIFGSILKGRNLEIANPNKRATASNLTYAVVLYEGYESDYLIRLRNIDLADWNLFGTSYNVKYVFIVGANNIEVKNWNNYIQ